jgi:hypothetical protein
MNTSDPKDELSLALAELASDTLEPSAALRRAIAEIPARYPHAERVPGFWGHWWSAIAAGAFAMSLGVLSGWAAPDLGPTGATEADELAELSLMALADDFDGDWE